MAMRLEHASLSVHDIDGVIRFLATAFPEFRIRRDKTESDGSRWVHIGCYDTDIALNRRARRPRIAGGHTKAAGA